MESRYGSAQASTSRWQAAVDEEETAAQGVAHPGRSILVLAPLGPPRLDTASSRALLALLRAVAESGHRGSRGRTRAA